MSSLAGVSRPIGGLSLASKYRGEGEEGEIYCNTIRERKEEREKGRGREERCACERICARVMKI